MKSRWLRIAAYGLLALVLFLGLLWLALPRLLGFAAERWLRVPGLETQALDVASVGPQQLRAREVRGVYHTAGGDRWAFTLHGVDVDYSLPHRRIDRLNIAKAEVVMTPGARPPEPAAPKAPVWPELAWPKLPFRRAQVADMHITVQLPQREPVQASGRLEVQQDAETLRATLQAPTEVLLLSATPGTTVDVQAEWRPQEGPGATARLRVGRSPAQQPLTLEAKAPLPAIEKLLGTAAGHLDWRRCAESRGHARCEQHPCARRHRRSHPDRGAVAIR